MNHHQPNSPKVTIEHVPAPPMAFTGDEFHVRFAFNEILVDTLKHTVPRDMRSWQPRSKTWVIRDYISALQFARAARRLEFHVESNVDEFRSITDTWKPAPKASPVVPWADALYAAVGPDRIDAVHRALTKVLHPDATTGDANLMRDLNIARDRQAVKS